MNICDDCDVTGTFGECTGCGASGTVFRDDDIITTKTCIFFKLFILFDK
jgi:hypothetical protein